MELTAEILIKRQSSTGRQCSTTHYCRACDSLLHSSIFAKHESMVQVIPKLICQTRIALTRNTNLD